jgi:hypothetical protein
VEDCRAEVEVTPAMIEAGVSLCRQEYQWTDRRLSEATALDVRRIVEAVLSAR